MLFAMITECGMLQPSAVPASLM